MCLPFWVTHSVYNLSYHSYVSFRAISLITGCAASQREMEIKAAKIQSSEFSYSVMMFMQLLRWKGFETIEYNYIEGYLEISFTLSTLVHD